MRREVESSGEFWTTDHRMVRTTEMGAFALMGGFESV